MAINAARTTSHPAPPIPEVAALRPTPRGGIGRTLGRLTRLALGGAGVALLLAPAPLLAGQFGSWAGAAVAGGWTAAQAAGAGLLGFAGLWAIVALLRRPRWAVTPQSAREGAVREGAVRERSLREEGVPAGSAGTNRDAAPAIAGRIGGDELEAEAAPAPKRVDDIDPAAVRSNWSASGSSADRAARSEAPATVPFPAAAIAAPETDEDTDAETVARHQEWPGEWDEEGNEPSVIRFEDVPRVVEVGGRVIDLTEMEFDGGQGDKLKGLSKKERRTVRKALRNRERMLLRAA